MTAGARKQFRRRRQLPASQRSGLREALTILDGVEGIARIEMTQKDIVRHRLVTRIVKAYEEYNQKDKNNESINKD